MITDGQLRLAGPAQPVAGTGTLVGAAPGVAGNTAVDLLSANRNIGRGQDMRLAVTVDVTATGGTSIQPQLIESANADLSSPSVIASGPVTTLVGLTAGAKIWDTALPDNARRYYGIQFVRVGTFTAGAVSAHIVSDTDYTPYVPSVTGY